MMNHYQLTETAYNGLLESGVSVVDLIKGRHMFRPPFETENECVVSPLMLMYYMDEYGDFNSGFPSPHKEIAKAVFNSMSSAQKIEIMMYFADEEELDEHEENAHEDSSYDEEEIPTFNWKT